jgi:hypothetical protein
MAGFTNLYGTCLKQVYTTSDDTVISNSNSTSAAHFPQVTLVLVIVSIIGIQIPIEFKNICFRNVYE